ncbi:hypothetical protein [Mariniblastus fucicola]|uniref:Uncharacterized protein n=1 Tax=Mariniblastus fucicola TaxID=980251 RepID=A0A5B9PDF5_9BACT|nr:hypothetical protein [Mariniblastus fucicola]QEG22606.1 hypothetical protein MFFC18_24890 [Mariniblastus fucicola]
MEESGIEITPLGDGVEICLPCRLLGGVARAGWFVIAFGAMATLFMISWISVPVGWGINVVWQGNIFGLLLVGFGCFGLVGLYGTAKLLALGMAIVHNRTRCVVTVGPKRIVSCERFGWFSFKTKINRGDVKQLFVLPLAAVKSGERDSDDEQKALGLLGTFFGGDASDFFSISTRKLKGKLIAPAYPADVLQPVAAAVAQELNRNRSDAVLIVRDSSKQQQPSPKVGVTVEQLSKDEIESADFELPEDSELEAIEEGDSVVYRIPKRTLSKGSNGLFMFSVFWNGFLLLVTLAMIKANAFDWPPIAIITGFWLVGIGLLVTAIYLARQSAMIGVKDRMLFIERTTIFGTRWTEFQSAAVESLEVADANMEVNGVPVMNLRIQPHEGKAVKMFSHLDPQELRWLAQQLRRELGVEEKRLQLNAETFDYSSAESEPHQTDIEVHRDADSTAIRVPPLDFEGSATFQIIGLTMCLLPFPGVLAAIWFAGFDFMFVMFGIVATAIGATMVAIHRVISTRQFQIDVSRNQLDVRVDGFMTNRHHVLSYPQIRSVEVVDSGVKVNNRSMYCLKVKAKQGAGVSIMTGRRQDELVYVASLIREKLNLDPASKSD